MFLAIIFSKSSFTRVYFRIAFRAVQESLPRPHSLVRELLPLLALLCRSVVSSSRYCTHTFFSSHPVHVVLLYSAVPLWTQVCRFNPVWTAAPSSPVSDAAPGGQHLGNGAQWIALRGGPVRSLMGAGPAQQPAVWGSASLKIHQQSESAAFPWAQPPECVKQQTLILLIESVNGF